MPGDVCATTIVLHNVRNSFAQFSVQLNYNINRICFFVFFIMLLDILELIIINYFHITLI